MGSQSLTPSPILCTFAVVQLLSHVRLLVTPWTVAHQTLLNSTISWSLLKFTSIESVMLPNHLILCHPLSFCLQSFQASGSFSSESVLHIRGPEYWSFSFSVSPSNDWILEGQCLGIRNVSVGIKNANLEFGELEGQFS